MSRAAVLLGLQLLGEQIEAFNSYLSLLLTWNSRFNLTSIRSTDQITRLHFIDSLAVLPFISPGGRILDVGSGAGFPGIPLKIVLPQKEVVLVESQRKKANFLRTVIRGLHLKGIEVFQERVEGLKPKNTGFFDEVITRAFGSPELFLETSAKLLREGGRCLIMQGPKGAELYRFLLPLCANLGYGETRLELYNLPPGKEKRTLLVFIRG